MVVNNMLAFISCKAKWLEFYLLGSFLFSAFDQIKGTMLQKPNITTNILGIYAAVSKWNITDYLF